MINSVEQYPPPVVASLESLTGPLEPLGRNRWALPADPGSASSATARLGEGWLTLQSDWNGAASPAFPSEAEYMGSLLALNSDLGPFCKIGLGPRGDLLLTAEMPLDDESDACGDIRIESLLCGFKDALKRDPRAFLNNREFAGDATSEVVLDAEDTGELLTQLAQRCDETGWLYELRSSSLALTLEAHDNYYQAELTARADGSTRLGFSLSIDPSNLFACKLASAVLLLRTCRAVRGVRAAWSSFQQDDPYRFEVTWDELPTSSDLAHALAGLSLAARLCGAETQALQQEVIAQRFLTFQGWSLKELSATASIQ